MPDKKLTEGTTALDYEGTLKNLTKEYYDALDLINRQDEEINRLQAKLDEAEDTIQFADKELKKAEAEVERLNTYLDVIGYSTDKIKAEAYKEFAELIKKDFENPYIQKSGLDFVDFLKGVVDNRLKRTVGEDK